MYDFQFEGYREWKEREAREWARREVAAFRRRKRLDLRWARVWYGVALLCGAAIAFDDAFDVFWLLGLLAAFLGAWLLDRHLGAEVVERVIRGEK